MNNQEYWNEVNEIAEAIAEQAMLESDTGKQASIIVREDAEELINDSLLHEAIDSHQLVIYYSYNLDVIKHSDNAGYMQDNFGAECIAASLESGGIDGLHTAMAFWALYADVQDLISDKLDQYEVAA